MTRRHHEYVTLFYMAISELLLPPTQRRGHQKMEVKGKRKYVDNTAKVVAERRNSKSLYQLKKSYIKPVYTIWNVNIKQK